MNMFTTHSSVARIHFIILVGMCAAIIGGCATESADSDSADEASPKTTSDVQLSPGSNEPEWIRKGNAAFSDFGKNAYYGVGSISGISNLPLATKAAEEQARANLVEGIKSNLDRIFKQYSSSARGNGEEESGQDVRDALKSKVSAVLVGAFVIDHWYDQSNGRIYALVRMEIDSAKRNMLKQLNDGGSKDYVKENADSAFLDIENLPRR